MDSKIIYIDMDDVLCQFSSAHAEVLTTYPEIVYPQSQYGFFRKLKPVDGALASAKYLMSRPDFEVYILTAPSVYNPSCYTEKREWVEMHLGMELVKRLIISPNKGLNKGDYLIDDHLVGRGQEHFEGMLIHFGSDQFPDWQSVLRHLVGGTGQNASADLATADGAPERRPEFNLDHKQFVLIQNSESGTVNSDTVFYYRQEGKLVTADYWGGSIQNGKIIAYLSGDQLDMLYHCVTTEGLLKAGQATAKVFQLEDERLKLALDWKWLAGGRGQGQSEYIEVTDL